MNSVTHTAYRDPNVPSAIPLDSLIEVQIGSLAGAKIQFCTMVQPSASPLRLKPSDGFAWVSIHSNHPLIWNLTKSQWMQ